MEEDGLPAWEHIRRERCRIVLVRAEIRNSKFEILPVIARSGFTGSQASFAHESAAERCLCETLDAMPVPLTSCHAAYSVHCLLAHDSIYNGLSDRPNNRVGSLLNTSRFTFKRRQLVTALIIGIRTQNHHPSICPSSFRASKLPQWCYWSG